MPESTPEPEPRNGPTNGGLKFLLQTISELKKSKNSDLIKRLTVTEERCRKQFVYDAMRLCGLHEANETGSEAELDAEQALICLTICGDLQECFQLIRNRQGAVDFIEGLVDRLGSTMTKSDSAPKSVLIRRCEIKKIHDMFKSLPAFALVTLVNLPEEVLKEHLKLHMEQHMHLWPFDRQQQSVQDSQTILRKTLKRLYDNGKGGRLTMAATVLLLDRLTTCIMKGMRLDATSRLLIPSILVKLQDYGESSVSPFIFDQKEIGALLDIYDSAAEFLEDDKSAKEGLRFTKGQFNGNLTHDMIGVVFQTHYWVEEVLEMLEDVSWKKFGTDKRAKKRESLIEAVSYYDSLPKLVILSSFDLQLHYEDHSGTVNRRKTLEKALGSPLECANEKNTQQVYEMFAVKISLESGVAMGPGKSFLPCMFDGIDSMAQAITGYKNEREGQLRGIKALEESTERTLAQSMSKAQAEISEKRIALKNLKEALKDTKEENTQLRNRQEKEREAIFDSLNSKICVRDGQLEVAMSRIKELERELRKAETHEAKEIKKERARALAAEAAHGNILAELTITKADLEAVELSRAGLESKHKSFKEKQREFVQKAEKVKKKLDERKAVESISKATQDMIDAMVSKAIRETEAAKEKEFAERAAIGNEKKDNDLKFSISVITRRDVQLKSKDEELVRKGEELMVMESLLQDKGRSLEAADEKYALLQSTMRDHFAKERELAESRENLKGMLD